MLQVKDKVLLSKYQNQYQLQFEKFQVKSESNQPSKKTISLVDKDEFPGKISTRK